jgi:hypothetical protein
MPLTDEERNQIQKAFDDQEAQIDTLRNVVLGMLDDRSNMRRPVEASKLDELRKFDELREQIADIMTLLPTALNEGRLPPWSMITRIECQIFHTPNLTANQRKAKTEWSLRLTIYRNRKRAKPDINVRLYPGERFYGIAMGTTYPIPTQLDQMAEHHRNGTDALLGMLQARIVAGGSPYIQEHICVLTGHLTDKPEVAIHIGDHLAHFDHFVIGKGIKQNRAKWYATWTN